MRGRLFRVFSLFIVSVVSAASTLSMPAALAQQPTIGRWHSPEEAKILAALRSETRVEFVSAPLSDVVQFLEDLHGIQIEIAADSLTDSGLDLDVEVTKNLRGISLGSALNIMLREFRLTYVIKDEVLLITTEDFANATMSSEVYHVQALADEKASQAELMSAIEQQFDPPQAMRNQPRAPSKVGVFRGMLVVQATLAEHRRIDRLLDELQTALRREKSGDQPSRLPTTGAAAVRQPAPALPAQNAANPFEDSADPFEDSARNPTDNNPFE
ncbi:MAG: hypothetical protein KDA60_14580 [Planctomycetales bacterium]|nr:hypothetical protein [Planctomycetales bacterium]